MPDHVATFQSLSWWTCAGFNAISSALFSISCLAISLFQLLLSLWVLSHDSATPWTVALQAPLSMWFSRQEYWNRLPFPSPGDLPDPGIEPTSLVSPPLAGRFFTTMPPGKPFFLPLLQALRLSRLLPTLLGFTPSETRIQYSQHLSVLITVVRTVDHSLLTLRWSN